jgi:hypothetical protein
MGDSLEEFLAWRLTDKRHDVERWEFEYSISRHLMNLSDTALECRYRSICKNISFLVSASRDEIPIQASFHSTWWWLRKRTHLIAEYALRKIRPPLFEAPSRVGDSIPIPFWQARPHDYKTLIRYGEAQWLVPLVERGHIRFTPASSYKNEELGPARYDDELNQSTFSRGDRVTVTMPNGKRAPLIGDFKTTVKMRADMYVHCVGSEFDARLFAEFPDFLGRPANAYCVIWDVEEFYRRILVGAQCSSQDGPFTTYQFHISTPTRMVRTSYRQEFQRNSIMHTSESIGSFGSRRAPNHFFNRLTSRSAR